MADAQVQNKTLREILTQALDIRGVSIERLSQLTDIPERYLIALQSGDVKKLPPAPYIRGYLMKIAEVLGIDGRELWEIYKNQIPVRTSGLEDRLPVNRFAIKTGNKKLIVFGIIIILGLTYLVSRGNELLGTPQITILNPATNNLIVSLSTIKLSGEIDGDDKLLINNEEILVGTSGHFEKDFPLEVGVNTFELRVKRFLGKETVVVRQVIYQPE